MSYVRLGGLGLYVALSAWICTAAHTAPRVPTPTVLFPKEDPKPEEKKEEKKEEDDGKDKKQSTTPAKPEKPNEVPGLTLPEDFTVPHDEGFVNIAAKCSGQVEWIVLATTGAPKFKNTDKEIIVAVPPRECVITIFCYGIVENKLTRAARCEVTVQSRTPMKAEDEPGPPTPPGPKHVTVIEDPPRRTQDYPCLTNWTDTRAKLIKAGHTPHLLSVRSAIAQNPQAGFKAHLDRVGVPALFVQDDKAKLVYVGPCPRTAEEIVRIVAGR